MRERERERESFSRSRIVRIFSSRADHGFTVIELLIVVAILGILSAAVVAVLSPAELLKQARDSTRVADLDTLNTALKLAEFNNVSMGSSSVVYLSLADTTSTCASYSLPTLPSGWSYRCATSANLNKTDGTGWIPVNFSAITETNVSSLPVDPSQNATSSLFYAYATGNRYALSAAFESAKYGDVAANDGGNDPSVYEAGGNPTLAPFMHGLVGYWNLDESSGSSLADSSGYGNTGTASGTTVVAGRIGNARSFNGTSDYARITGTSTVTAFNLYPGTRTFSFWTNYTSGTGDMLEQAYSGAIPGNLMVSRTYGVKMYYTGPAETACGLSSWVSAGQWAYITIIQSRRPNSETSLMVYVNGSHRCTVSGLSISSLSSNITTAPGSNLYLGARGSVGDTFYAGLIDDFRVYARALSANEIATLYAAR